MKKKNNTQKIKLTEKQELFCKEYIIDFNATQSYIRAGYNTKSEKNASVMASKMLGNASIQKKIQELKRIREEALQVNAEWVLKEAIEIYEIAKGKKPHIQSKVSSDSVTKVETYKTNLKEACRALEIIGKHTNIKAFDKEIDLGDNVTISIQPPKEFLK